MSDPTPPPPPPLDLAIIDSAPLAPAPQAEAIETQYLEIIAGLSAQLAELEAENDRLSSEQTVERVRAAMMRPYANKVFRFMVGYCVSVGAIILLSGWGAWGFHLSDTIMGILAGSTAVAVIGLIGTVVGGLFGAPLSGGTKS